MQKIEMKEKLLLLLNSHPATAGRPPEFLDTLADDIQAVIIRAIHPANTDDAVAALEEQVDEVYGSDFGVHLFNLYSVEKFPGKSELVFSARKRLVRAMIQTILVEQCIDYDCDVEDMPALLSNVTDGNTLKRRLTELQATPTPGALPN